MPMSEDAHGGQRHPISLELELQAVLNCLVGMLGSELGGLCKNSKHS